MKKYLVIICMLALIVTSANACSGGSSGPEQLASTLHALPTESEEKYNNDSSFQIAAGLLAKDDKEYPRDVDSLNEYQITEEFYNTYIEEYGMYDLLEHFNNYLICTEDADNFNPNDVTSEYVQEVNKRDKTVHETLYNLPAYKNLDTLVFDGADIQKNDNSEGYYAGMKSKSKNTEVKGEFNDINNDNQVYEESASQKESTSYYGDWMVKHESGSSYNEGKYGWSNGTFYDEPSSWESFSTFEIYYRGEKWVQISAESLEDIHLEFKKTEEQADKRFYFAFDNVRKAECVFWVSEPAESVVSSSDADPSASGIVSCDEYIEGFEQYLNNNFKEEGPINIEKDEEGKNRIILGGEPSMYYINFEVDGEWVDENQDMMSLLPDTVSFNGWTWADSFAKYSGAFIAYTDSTVNDINEGIRIVKEMHDQKPGTFTFQSGNDISGSFSGDGEHIALYYHYK